MKRLWVILFLLTGFTAMAQDDPAVLARNITKDLHTEKEKVTAIFRWITDNISYRTRSNKAHVLGKPTQKYAQWLNASDDTGALKPLNERAAINVLRTGEAICEGYARLFTTLCDYAGVRSEIIAGYARPNGIKPVARFGVNHYWNAVMIDGDWHLLDVTWASGYISRLYYGDEFVRQYDPAYFLTPPDIFIRDHYPDDIRWTLAPANRVPPEFSSSPFLQKSFIKYSITSFYPKKGVIEAKLGDTVLLELATADPERDKVISPDMLVDTTIFSESSSWVFLHPEKTQKPMLAAAAKHRYLLPVTKPDIEWVYLMYNDDMVLRYKVNVKQP